MASKPVANLLFNTIRRPLKTISPSILRPYSRLPLTLQPAARRFAHTIPKPPGQASSSPSEKQRRRMLSEPHYQLRFTCVPCGNRSAHTVSKIGYHHGSVLITCPSCRNRHIISDHLNIFGDRKITVEDLMREKGQLVKRGTLGEHGDVEFWADSIGDDAADSQPSPANAQESDASVEEVKREEVIKSRETRDPSSQSMDPKPRASASLGDAGARPSVGGSHHTNPISSTRRQYSTAQQSNTLRASSSGPDFFGMPRGDVSSYGRTSRLPEQHLASLRKYPSRAALRDALSERRSTLTQVSRKEMLREKHRIFVRRRHPKRTERRSMLTPVSKEKMLEKVHGMFDKRDGDANLRSGLDCTWPQTRTMPASESFSGVRYYGSSPPKNLVRSILRREREVMETPTVRRSLSQDRYNGVRLYNFDTVDGRPQYIRTGPGPLYKRRRPIPWAGQLEDENVEKDTSEFELEIPFEWDLPSDVPSDRNRTVYPTTARSWPQPRVPSYWAEYRRSEERPYLYKATAVRSAAKRSETDNMPVPLSVPD